MKKKHITQPQVAFVLSLLAFLFFCVALVPSGYPPVGAAGLCMTFSNAGFIMGLICLLSGKCEHSNMEKALAGFSIAIPLVILGGLFF